MVEANSLLPEALLAVIPDGRVLEKATLLEMAYTAYMVRKEGEPFEFRLKIHPESNRLPFLDQRDPFYECYQLLKRNPDGVLQDIVKKHAPESIHPIFFHADCPTELEPPRHSLEEQPKEHTDSSATHPPRDIAIIHGYSDSE